MEWFSLAVDAITALAIVFAAWQLLSHSRQMHRELEGLYVQRYWELMDQRSESFIVEGDPRPRDRRVIHAYLQLCEDEIDLRRLGRLTDNTWKFCAKPYGVKQLRPVTRIYSRWLLRTNGLSFGSSRHT
jgi:hypothetical protein